MAEIAERRYSTRDAHSTWHVVVPCFVVLLRNLMLSQEHVRNTAANRVDMRTIGTNHFSFRYVNLSVSP